jgi:hypothetical protein
MDTHMDYESALRILREKVVLTRLSETSFELVESTDISATILATYENSHGRSTTKYMVFKSGKVEEIWDYYDKEGKESPF